MHVKAFIVKQNQVNRVIERLNCVICSVNWFYTCNHIENMSKKKPANVIAGHVSF